MAVTVKKKFWGLDCIIRHDYEDELIQAKLKGYQTKSADSFKHFLTNVPNFNYGSMLDVGCGDLYAVNQFRDSFDTALGLDLYPGSNTEDIIVADWYTMAKKSKAVFPETVLRKNGIARFNGIFINHSLEHAENVYALMQQVSAMQDKDDAIFIAVPDGNSAFGYSITSSTTHFSCITEGFLSTTMQRFGYNVAIETREFRPGAPEIWAYGIKLTNGCDLK